jgi:hypothetical protein
MEIERLDPSRVSLEVVEALGLDPDFFELGSMSAITASVHRAASFLCPTPPRVLGRAVGDALSGLPGFPSEEGRTAIDATVEALVGLGDLIELPLDDVGGRRRHLFLGPPSYVSRSTGCILLGVRPEGAPIVSEELLDKVEYRGHLRLIWRREPAVDLEEVLAGEGLNELRSEQWLRAPRQSSPRELIDQYIARLDAAGRAGEIDGVRVIDPASDVAFYRGRWRELKPSDEGRFVARRPQAFGADLWCFAEVIGGSVERLIDLPIASPVALGSDEAWRLQAAIDQVSGSPQRLRVRRELPDGTTLDLFSPLPSWSQRRLELVATPAVRTPGALFSYPLSEADVDEEVRFLVEMMWLASEEVTNANHG